MSARGLTTQEQKEADQPAPARTSSVLSTGQQSALSLADQYLGRIVEILNEVGDTHRNPQYLRDGEAVTLKVLEIAVLIYCAKLLSGDDDFVGRYFTRSNSPGYRALFNFSLHFSPFLDLLRPQYDSAFCDDDPVVLRVFNALAHGMSDISTIRVGSAQDPNQGSEVLRYKISSEGFDSMVLPLINELLENDFVRARSDDAWFEPGHRHLQSLEGQPGAPQTEDERAEVFQAFNALRLRDITEPGITDFVTNKLPRALKSLDCSSVVTPVSFPEYRRAHRYSRRRWGASFALLGLSVSTYLESLIANNLIDHKDGLSLKEVGLDFGLRLGIAAIFFTAGFCVQWVRSSRAYKAFMAPPPAALARSFSGVGAAGSGAGGAQAPGDGQKTTSPLLL